MNRSTIRLIISLLIMLGILLIGPLIKDIKENNVIAAEEKRFVGIKYRPGYFQIVYDKQTKVEYAISKDGIFTLLVDADGKPLLYEGE